MSKRRDQDEILATTIFGEPNGELPTPFLRRVPRSPPAAGHDDDNHPVVTSIFGTNPRNTEQDIVLSLVVSGTTSADIPVSSIGHHLLGDRFAGDRRRSRHGGRIDASP